MSNGSAEAGLRSRSMGRRVARRTLAKAEEVSNANLAEAPRGGCRAGMVRRRMARLAKALAKAGLERGPAGLEGPSSGTVKNIPEFATSGTLIGY